MKKAAVIILNWNGRQLLERFLPSVVRHTPAGTAKIVVADNGSTDDSAAFLRENYPSVQLLRLDRNYGFAEGYNRAIEAVEAEYVVLLNSDVEVTKGWLDAPLEALDADPKLAAVQPKLLSEHDCSYFEYAGAAGGFIDRYGYPFCRGRIFSTLEKDEGQYDTPCDILWATGACLFIRREIYRNEGGLDARFFAHQEEIDLCWRLCCRGYRLRCIPQSTVYHVGGGTLQAEKPQKTFLNFRNNLLLLYKNLPPAGWRRIAFIRFWLDYVAAFRFLVEGHPANAAAVFKARRAFCKLKKAYAGIREENRRKSVAASLPGIYPGSVVKAYYIEKKRKFTELAFGKKEDRKRLPSTAK
ncbi:MAG: glycosyltransferase family 2 protein [Parabacteroides sp.]|nr:glycosyltransferase family 2 protein [Parabacteroides sp.]